MSTTNDYLNELVNQKKQLAQNLTTKGIEASEDEKFNTLVPKVLEIQSGGGGGSIETCTVTITVPAAVVVVGWGEFTMTVSGTAMGENLSMPSLNPYRHAMPIGPVVYNFPNLAIGSTFVFYYSSNIKGANVSDNIEFSFVNDKYNSTDNYKFAICRCNGDGEITINV